MEANLAPANPAYHTVTGQTIWSYVYFGSYPQSEVNEADLTPAIKQADYTETSDAWVNGTKYRRLRKEDAANPEFFGNSDFRYFLWEPIKWRVMQNNEKTLFVIADIGLDCKMFHDIKAYNTFETITWETCSLRHWLNNDFYQTAFNSSEQKAIVQQEVINHAVPEFHYHADCGNNTNDFIYLLSIPELRNTIYGFWDTRIDWEHKRNKKANRIMKASNYAHARGVWLRPDNHKDYSCHWWLRSICDDHKCGVHMMNLGDIFEVGYSYNYFPREAVVPVLHLDLLSNCWTMETKEEKRQLP